MGSMPLTTKHYLWIGNLLVMGLVVWSAVTFGLSIYTRQAAPAATVEKKVDTGGTGQISTRSLAQYEDLSRSGLFGAEKSAPEVVAPGESDASPAIQTSDDLRLKGTVAGDTGYQAAIFENTSTNEQSLYRVGERVGDAELVKVDKDKAVIRRDGRDITLEIFEDEATAAVKAPPAPFSKAGPENGGNGQIVKSVGPNSYVIERELLSRQLSDLNQILSQVVIRPIEIGGTSGFQLASVRRGSLVQKLGFNRGDIIISINEVPVSSPEDLVNLYQQLGQLDSAEVMVQRHGNLMPLTYTFR
jgi:general secretion pathway protein C